MPNKTAYVNTKLSKFFAINNINKKMKKDAGIGNFRDVHSPEDIREHALMIAEMLELPKYDNVRRQLREARGVVNFVISGAYAPLWELLLRNAIPPKENDIYNLGNIVTTPDDYFIDAQATFGGLQEDTQREEAKQQFHDMLFGAVRKQDRQWLRETDIYEEDVNGEPIVENYHILAPRFYGEALELLEADESRQTEPTDREVQEEALKLAQEHVNMILRYEKELERLENNDLVRALRDAEQKLREDAENRYVNATLSAQERADVGLPELPKEERNRLLKKLRTLRTQYYVAKQVINNKPVYRALNERDIAFSGDTEREGGFLDWDPTDKIVKNFNAFKKVGNKPNMRQTVVNNLHDAIQEFPTYSPGLLKAKQDLLAMIGSPNERGNKVFSNVFQFTKRIKKFLESARRHGHAMIMTNFEGSSLAKPANAVQDNNINLNDGGSLIAFNQRCESLETRSRGKETTEKPSSKTLILVTEVPIAKLPSSNIISMDVSPVDEKEAEIIVRHIMQSFHKRAWNTLTENVFSEIERLKSEGNLSGETLQQRKQEAKSELLSKKDITGVVSENAKQKIIDMIIGVGQEVAIKTVEYALAMAQSEERNDEGILQALDLDEDELIKTVTSQINRNIEDASGITRRKPHVKIDNYIYSKKPDSGGKPPAFGILVEDFKSAAQHAKLCTRDINLNKQRVSEINGELKQNISDERRQELQQEKAEIQTSIARLVAERHNAMKTLPHFMILYGPPGSGKTVFADAVADVCDYTVYDVDASSLKSKWVGESSKNTDKLINTIFGGARRAVFLFDELDRKLQTGGGNEGGSGSGGGSTSSQIAEEIMGKFLSAFEDKKETLIERDVFIVVTTNRIDNIPSAFRNRAPGGNFEVKQSDDPDDYVRFIEHFIETEKSHYPRNPWVIGRTPEEGWELTEELIKSIDTRAVAEAFCNKKLSFRDMSHAIERAVQFHNAFNRDIQSFARGDTDELRGIPYTTENLLLAAEYAVPNLGGRTGTQETFGMYEAAGVILQTVNEQLQDKMEQIQTETRVDPNTQREMEMRIVPQEIIELAKNGQQISNRDVPEDIYNQFEVGEETVETEDGPMKRKVLKPRDQQETPMQTEETEETGFEEMQDLMELQDDEVESSTDYLYNYLKKQGLLDENGEKLIINQKKSQNKVAEEKNVNKDEKTTSFTKWVDFTPWSEQYGVHVFSDGQLAAGPSHFNIPPQNFTNS